MIKTIIFDLGKVLISWDPRNLYRKIFDDEAVMEDFLANVTTMNWNEQQDAGRKWSVAIELLVEEHPRFEAEIRAYFDRWTEMLNGEIKGTVEILKEIHERKKYRLYALTNWSDELFHHALERFEFLQLFEGIVISGKENMKKPDLRIYNLILDRYQIEPETAVFIDDSQRNIAAAIKAKIQGIHFQSPEQLRQDLEAMDVL
ncbi:MAG: HAD family hydrolase [Saprospiraceae bacterium]